MCCSSSSLGSNSVLFLMCLLWQSRGWLRKSWLALEVTLCSGCAGKAQLCSAGLCSCGSTGQSQPESTDWEHSAHHQRHTALKGVAAVHVEPGSKICSISNPQQALSTLFQPVPLEHERLRWFSLLVHVIRELLLLNLTKRDFHSKSYGQLKPIRKQCLEFSYGLQMAFPILYTSSSVNIECFLWY